MPKRNWLVEDNLIALYIALHDYKNLKYSLSDIQNIIPHKGFPMRIQNYRAIITGGKEGLDAGQKSPLFNELYDLFKDFSQVKFSRLVNSILSVKAQMKESS
jgi:hypothetical protein